MPLITFTDKQTMNTNANVPAINKITSGNVNEIKNVVNTNWNIRQVATVGLSADVSMSTSSQYTTLTLNSVIDATSNSNMTLESFTTTTTGAGAGIKIPAGITKVKVDANIQYTNSSSGAMSFINYVYKYKASDGTVNIIARTIGRAEASQNVSCVVAPFVLSVAEGDIIFLRAYKGTAGNAATVGSGISRTFLTVEGIE